MWSHLISSHLILADKLAELAVDAVLQILESPEATSVDLDDIRVVKVSFPSRPFLLLSLCSLLSSTVNSASILLSLILLSFCFWSHAGLNLLFSSHFVFSSITLKLRIILTMFITQKLGGTVSDTALIPGLALPQKATNAAGGPTAVKTGVFGIPFIWVRSMYAMKYVRFVCFYVQMYSMRCMRFVCSAVCDGGMRLHVVWVRTDRSHIIRHAARVGLIQYQLSPPKPYLDSKVVIADYTQMDRAIREEKKYIAKVLRPIRKAKCNVLLIQKR